MLIMKDIVKSIREELKDVKKYADLAANVKPSDPQLARTYAELGGAEVTHVDKLHKAAVDLINKYTASGKEIPPAMKSIWEFEHQMMIEELADAKRILELANM